MIVVKVGLQSAVTGRFTELGSMRISNDGLGTDNRCNYDVEVMRKGHDVMSAGGRVTRAGRVENHARHAEVIWRLIGKALASVGYDK